MRMDVPPPQERVVGTRYASVVDEITLAEGPGKQSEAAWSRHTAVVSADYADYDYAEVRALYARLSSSLRPLRKYSRWYTTRPRPSPAGRLRRYDILVFYSSDAPS